MTLERRPPKRNSPGTATAAITDGVSSEVGELLRKLAGDVSSSDAEPGVARSAPPEREHLIEAAQKTIALRQLRKEYLATDALGEPAWDLLLALYVEEHTGRSLTQLHLSRVTGVAKTTTLRSLRGLIDDGLVECEPNRFDRRALLHRLSPACRRGLDRYFESVQIAFL